MTDNLELTFLGTTSDKGSCPNVYETNRGTYVLQGEKVTDPGALATLKARGLPDHETAVEVPKELMQNVPGFQA
jgi:hypothetical protein